MATAVAVASAVLGLCLAAGVTRQSWGLRQLAALSLAGVVMPPAFAAIGLRSVFAGLNLLDGVPSARWVIWFWSALVQATPLLALTVASALGKVEPAWIDAARLAGAGRARIGRQLIWPTIRPDLARAVGVVFAGTLIEPGAPIVLGLRRTLGFQIAESAMVFGPMGRAAVLALGATVLVACLRTALSRWGGVPVPPSPDPIVARPERPGWKPIVISACVLMLTVGAVWLPVAGLISAAVRPGLSATSSTAPASIAAFKELWRDPLLFRFAVNSAIVGVAVFVLDLVFARASAGGDSAAGISRWASAMPELAIGVGALALPGVLSMVGDGLSTLFGTSSLPEQAVRAVVDRVDPDRTPFVLLVCTVGFARLPMLAASTVAYRKALRPTLLDAATTLGATPSRARSMMTNPLLALSPGAAILAIVLAATSLTPALLLCPTADVRTIGPAILVLDGEAGIGPSRAAALAAVTIVLNLVALAIAARGRPTIDAQDIRV